MPYVIGPVRPTTPHRHHGTRYMVRGVFRIPSDQKPTHNTATGNRGVVIVPPVPRRITRE